MTDEPEIPEETEEEKKYKRGEHPNTRAKCFGGSDANPQSQNAGAAKPWSYRSAARYISAQRVDMSDPKALGKLTPKNPTVAELIIANTVAKASKGDMRAVEYLTEQVDGKVAQTNINAEFAQIMNMTDEQIDEELNRYYEGRRANAPEQSSASGESEGSPSDSTPAAGG